MIVGVFGTSFGKDKVKTLLSKVDFLNIVIIRQIFPHLYDFYTISF